MATPVLWWLAVRPAVLSDQTGDPCHGLVQVVVDDPEVAQLLGLTTLPRRLSHPGLCLFDAVTSTHEAAHQLLIVRGVHEQAEGVGDPLQDLPASSHVELQEEVP